MKNKLLIFASLMFALVATSLKAQLNVGGGSNAPNANAMLQVTSGGNKGFLFPQVALTRTTLAAPLAAHVAGMMVYNTATVNDVTPGPYYNDGTKWYPFAVPPLTPCATPIVSAVSGTGSIAPGGSATFSVTASSYTSIVWVIKNSAGTTISSGTGLTTGAQTFATADTYTVTFTATNAGSCGTTTNNASGTETVNVSACPAPTGLSVANSASTINAGGSSTFTLSGTNLSSATWVITPSTGISASSGSGLSTGAITFSIAGSYTVTFTASSTGSCTTTTATATTTETVNVSACPAPTGLSVANSASTINAGGSSTFTLSGTNLSSATWVITPSTGVSTASGTGLSTGSISFSTAGSYTVTFTASSTGSCTTTSATAGTTETVNTPVAVVSALSCGSSSQTGTLVSGTSANGISISVPYSGGNGGPYGSYSISSTGVSGLTATASAGNVASGNGNVTFTITGTPSAAGTASFALSLGGQSCSFTATVYTVSPTVVTCNNIKNYPFSYTSGGNTVIGSLTQDGITVTNSAAAGITSNTGGNATNCNSGIPIVSGGYFGNGASSSTFILTFSVPVNNVDLRLLFSVGDISNYTSKSITITTSNDGTNYSASSYTRLAGCTWSQGSGGVLTASTPSAITGTPPTGASDTFYKISSGTNYTQIKIVLPVVSNGSQISAALGLCDLTF